MTPSNRKLLAKIKAKLNPPPPPVAKPVDLRPVLARMNMILIAPHESGKRPGESYLTRFARALRFRDDAELFRTAVSDRGEFVRRYIVSKPPVLCLGSAMPAYQEAIAKDDTLRATIEPVDAKATPENSALCHWSPGRAH